MSHKIGTVYMLHFHPPYKHARHYIGFVEGKDTAAVKERLRQHLVGQGARLVEVVAQAGHAVIVTRVWRKKTRCFERSLKKREQRPLEQFCVLCRRKHAK